MCVSSAPALFSETTLYHGRCHHPEHGRIHVLGYQNTALSRTDQPNAMLLHLPGTGMTQANFVDTSGSRHILTDMTMTLGPPLSRGYGAAPGGMADTDAPPKVEVFEHDIYTVVLASNAALIPDALSLVPEHKRIPVNRPLFDFYARLYPDYAVALCCFNNRDAARSAPLLLWYEPLRPDRVELPAIDCHTGGIPQIGGPVDVDHWVVLGTDEESPSWNLGPVPYDLTQWRSTRMYWTQEDLNGPVGPFLPKSIAGRTYSGMFANGDFMIPSADLDTGRFTAMSRVGPGGAPLAPATPFVPPQ
jgi:hypothetical protein